MYVDFDKLDKAGYDVRTTKVGVRISAKEPMELPYDGIRDLLLVAGLNQNETDHGIEALVTEVEMVQIMAILR